MSSRAVNDVHRLAEERARQDIEYRHNRVVSGAHLLLSQEERRRRMNGEEVLPLGPSFERINSLRKRHHNVSEGQCSSRELVLDVVAAIPLSLDLPEPFVEDLIDLFKRGLHESSPVPSGPDAAHTCSARDLTVQDTAGAALAAEGVAR